jgi:predicted CoA-binding protein
MFENPAGNEIESLLRRARVIAVLGLSSSPDKPSYHVAEELQKFGYRIVPVTPAATRILGERAWPDLESALRRAGPVDLVDVFRRPEHVAAVVDDCIRLRVPALWLQEGVVDEAAALRARAAGIFTVMDRCIFKVRSAMGAADIS